MKKIALIISCVLLSAITFQSCKPNDEKINSEVIKVLGNGYSAVSVATKGGVVTLSGLVDSQEEKDEAARLAHSVKDVKEIVNEIEVREPVSAPVINPDDNIKADIRAKLESSGFKNIVIDVKDGEVILTGDLKRSDLVKVMQIANESNPRKVINNLKLK
ncbi:MAG: BON domain-containing protein [Dysgonomonas sp.]|nr:BON domain-containing protein [Dysgonomonas sp.]